MPDAKHRPILYFAPPMMQTCQTQTELTQILEKAYRQGAVVGFVPTMGALHAGHLSLIGRARQECQVVVASIFINPLQFDQASDLAAYPQRHEADAAMLSGAGADLLFLPNLTDIYPDGPPRTRIDFGTLEQVLEGAHRPGHFAGVGMVVARLLHLVAPTRAYFGQKDLQQLAVIRQLVLDLAFPVEVVPCETVREADGLAMSSRNERLSTQGRALAPHLYQALSQAWAELQTQGLEATLEAARVMISAHPDFTLEYLEAVDPYTFLTPTNLDSPLALCVAARLEGVRLIDNLVRWKKN